MDQPRGHFAGVAAALLCVLAVGCGDKSSPTGTSTTSTTPTPTPSTTTSTGPAKASSTTSSSAKTTATAPKKSLFESCFKAGGAVLSKNVRDVPNAAVDASSSPFGVQFKDSIFGPQVNAVVFLPYKRPAQTKKFLVVVRKAVSKRRRIILREHLLVVFGSKSNQKSSKLVLKCVNAGVKS